ncbi:hypothetical protein [Microvirga mediterraneensis]|uniref:PXPV repeat-containing protein n=1 Tax=Microvirga mediterraneensis TaxID=2754695 RepID=A0A838BR81_9HYPH|nr:hypothetical protein [Microvirga mediterraneensis]MBA1157472.1 hypothetical protein [Microvirga mediterraneensis]
MKIFRLVSGTAAALALVTGLAAAQPAAARDRLSPGAAVALGALGGLAVGAVVGSAVAQPQPPVVYRAPPPPPPPVYVEEAAPVYYERPVREVYVERCTTERYREWVPGWGWEHRTRRICN